MDSIDIAKLQRRVRRTYEFARLRQAALGMAPLVAIVALATCFTHRPSSALVFGSAAFVLGAIMLWFGREPQKAVLPGLAAGVVPLIFALCANYVHACGMHGCSTWCVPACALGGVVAGLTVAGFGNQRRAGPLFWLSASSFALLIGAMGCSCVGYSGIFGLVIGFAGGTVPGLVRRLLVKGKSVR
jgi:hypothetical protein